MKEQDKKTKQAFIEYLEKYPELRFWQAVRNFSGADFIYWNKLNKKQVR